jgi:phosphohistidine phosphatase
MKRLVIIRHAKTEQEGYHRDFDRQLVERGIEDAKSISLDLKEWKIIPQAIISSPAARAIHTARLFAQSLGFAEENIQENKELYFDFTTQQFIDMLNNVSNQVETLFVVGHNPFMHYIAQNMCKNYDGHMPTCSTVVIDFDVDSWLEVEPRQGLLFLHLYPKIYK